MDVKKRNGSSPGSDCPAQDIKPSPPVSASQADPNPAGAPPWRNYEFEEADLPVLDSERACFLEELALSHEATGIIRKSRLLMRMHHFMTHPEILEDQSPVKKAPHILSSIDADELKGAIFRKLDHEEVYLAEELTISAFAHELGIEPHHLSRFLNLHLNTTYTDLINSYRVLEAKTLLIDKPQDAIIDIAFASGFNSKASFNRIFKKTTGMTPSEYRLKHKAGRYCPR